MKKTTILLFLFCTSIFFGQDKNYSIKNLEVNTSYSDFGTTYYGDSIVIYASAKPEKRSIRNRIWNQNNQPFLQLYTGVLSSEGQIENSTSFSKKINSRLHESNVSFTKDLKTVYFSRDNSLNGRRSVKDDDGWVLIQLYKATVSESGEWDNITAMPFNDDNYQTGHPSLNAAEDKLYFTSDMPGGFGQTDIYVVDINSDGTYGTPKNLGADVNTPSKEMFPFINGDDILYYSSDNSSGLGGLDIYSTKSDGAGGYYTPINLGYPLNSLKDDFSITYQRNSKKGHFSSNRDGGHGDDDIYFFEELKPTNFECNQIARGVVRDKNTNALLAQSVVVLYKEGSEIERVIVGSDGAFVFTVSCDTDYKVVAHKQGWLGEDVEEFTTSIEADLELELALVLEEEKKESDFVHVRGKVLIKINPIYFDFDKSFIREDAKYELATVISVMRKYPNIIIEGGSHTDSRGRSSYNEALSSRRARSTVAYIIKVGGIDPSRISAKGYGEYQLANNCSDGVKCSEFDHQLNRRTEFVIVNPEVLPVDVSE